MKQHFQKLAAALAVIMVATALPALVPAAAAEDAPAKAGDKTKAEAKEPNKPTDEQPGAKKKISKKARMPKDVDKVDYKEKKK